MPILIVLIVIGVALATIWGIRSSSARAQLLRRRLPTLYGAIGGVTSLLLPWVSFSLLDDLDIVPPLVLEALPMALEILADLLRLTPLGIVAWLLDRTMSLPGYMLFVAMPRLHPTVVWAVAAPAAAGLISLIAGLIAFLAPGRLVSRIAAGLQLMVSAAGLSLLLAEMPRLDQWGTMGDFKTGVMAVSIGTGLDFGAWVAIAALGSMAAGAVLTLMEPACRSSTTGYPRRAIGSSQVRLPPWSSR